MSYNTTNTYSSCDKCNIKKKYTNCRPMESVNYLYTNTGLRSLQARYYSHPVYAGIGDASSNEPHYSSSDVFYTNLEHTPQIQQHKSYVNYAGVGVPNDMYSSADNMYKNENVVLSNTEKQVLYSNVAGVGGSNYISYNESNIPTSLNYTPVSSKCVENFIYGNTDVEDELAKKMNFNIIRN